MNIVRWCVNGVEFFCDVDEPIPVPQLFKKLEPSYLTRNSQSIEEVWFGDKPKQEKKRN